MSLTKCVNFYIEKIVGCALPWNKNSAQSKLCATKEDLINFQEVTENLLIFPASQFLDTTGCYPSCTEMQYTIRERSVSTEYEATR